VHFGIRILIEKLSLIWKSLTHFSRDFYFCRERERERELDFANFAY
jgi:hypothetical protein